MRGKPSLRSLACYSFGRGAQASPRFQRSPRLDRNVVPDDASFCDVRLRPDRDPASNDRFLYKGVRADADSLPKDRLAHDRAGTDAAALPEHHVRANFCARIDYDVGIGVYRRNHAWMAIECIAAVAAQPGLHRQRHRAAEHITMRREILLRPSDIEPIVVRGVSVKLHPLRDRFGEGDTLDGDI